MSTTHPDERMTLDELDRLADAFEAAGLSDAAVRLMRDHARRCRRRGVESVQRLGYREFIGIAVRAGVACRRCGGVLRWSEERRPGPYSRRVGTCGCGWKLVTPVRNGARSADPAPGA